MGLKKDSPFKVDLYVRKGVHDKVISFWESVKTTRIGNQTLINLIQRAILAGGTITVDPFLQGGKLNHKLENGCQSINSTEKYPPIRLSINKKKYPLVVEFWQKLDYGLASGVFLLLIEKALDQNATIELNASDYFTLGEDIVMDVNHPKVGDDAVEKEREVDYTHDETVSQGGRVTIGDLFKG